MATHRFLSTLILVLLFGSGAAVAGTTEVRSQEGEISRFEYSGDMLRIGGGGQAEGYMIMRDGRVYVVNESDGNTMVMDISQALGMFGAMANAATPSMANEEVISLQPTGAKETHAGITGEVYQLRYRDSEGKERETELVLTDDKRALEFRDAMLRFAKAMARNLGKDQPAPGNNMQEELMSLDKGVLRYGNEMSVVALDTEAVDPARFELPAPPTDLSGIGAILSGAFSRQPPAEPGEEGAEGDDGPQEPAPSPAEEITNALKGIFGR